ncbi:MAG: hypothetical protein ACI3YC_04085, partial [Alloprevotella sp.]
GVLQGFCRGFAGVLQVAKWLQNGCKMVAQGFAKLANGWRMVGERCRSVLSLRGAEATQER